LLEWKYTKRVDENAIKKIRLKQRTKQQHI